MTSIKTSKKCDVTISILCVFNGVYDVNYVETQINQSKTSRLHKFMRNGQNDHKTVRTVLFPSKKYAKQTRNEIFCIFAGITSHTPDSKLYNFITS